MGPFNRPFSSKSPDFSEHVLSLPPSSIALRRVVDEKPEQHQILLSLHDFIKPTLHP